MGSSRNDRRIRARRPDKIRVDPWAPIRVLLEEERLAGREGTAPSLTLFLIGGECPFTCVYCDLWRQTTDAPTPQGAIATQIRSALAAINGPVPAQVKLYNASNFFDSRAVSPSEDDAIVELLEPFDRVVVECHPRLIGDRCLRFAAALGESRLEVAMGLETARAEALARLNKKMTVADYDRAAATLRERGIGIRTFVLIGVPFVDADEQLESTLDSVRHAARQGAGVVSMVPLRAGNGEMESLVRRRVWRPPDLALVEACLDAAVGAIRGGIDGCVVQVDLWDLERLASCRDCCRLRLDRLARINRTGLAEPAVECQTCGRRAGVVTAAGGPQCVGRGQRR